MFGVWIFVFNKMIMWLDSHIFNPSSTYLRLNKDPWCYCFIYIYNIDFWSGTNSNTFICNSEFHASHEAIIRQLTTVTVTFKDIQIWEQGTMPTNVTCQDVIGGQKRWTIGELYIKWTQYLTRMSIECLQIDVSSFLWLSVDISGLQIIKTFSHRHITFLVDMWKLVLLFAI